MRGGLYSSNLLYDKGLDFYFKSLELAEKTDNQYFVYVNKHNIALIKGDVGNFKESLDIFKECYEREVGLISKDGYIYDYILSGLSLSEAFIRNRELDSARYYLDEIYGNGMDYFSNNNEEYLQYQVYKYISDYNQSKKLNYRNLNVSLEKIKEFDGDTRRTLLFGNYHAGILRKEIGEYDFYKHFNLVDSVYASDNVVIPEVRLSFEELIKYYKKKNNPQKQLLYVDKLLKFDSIHSKQFKILASKINENYDTPLLLAEKELLIDKLNKKNTTLSYGSILLILLIIILIIVTIYSYKRTKSLKTKFQNIVDEPLVAEINEKTSPLIAKSTKKELSISSKIVDQVLENLIKFENDKQYTNRNLTSGYLAKKVGTNSKYLSQIINYSKNKNITSYINDLRIEYTIKLLKADNKILNYTIQSIAEEVGFNNAESFSKAFLKKTGLKPSYFIKQLKSNKL